MNDWLIDHEPAVRLGAFVSLFASMALWELVTARHQLSASKRKRWFANLSLVVVNAAILRLLFPMAAMGTAIVAAERGWGLLNATSMFNHGNVRLPGWLDRALRWIVVTPDMHRVHHSVERSECNSNFGFSLPWWDRLLGTYRNQPAAGHEAMTIGVSHLLKAGAQPLVRLITLPFAEQPGGYPMGRRGKKSA